MKVILDIRDDVTQIVSFSKENNFKFCLMLLFLVLNSTLCDNHFTNAPLFFPVIINL